MEAKKFLRNMDRHFLMRSGAVFFALLPLVFIPGHLELLSDFKLFFLSLSVSVLVILYSCTAFFQKKKVEIPFSFGILSLSLLLPLYLISTFYSLERPVSLFGFGGDTLSIFSFLIFGGTFFSVFLLFKSKRDHNLLITFLVATLFGCTLFQIAKIFFPSLLSLYTFFGATVGIMGSFVDFGVICFLLFGIFYIVLSRVELSVSSSIFFYGALILSFFGGHISGITLDAIQYKVPLSLLLPIFLILVDVFHVGLDAVKKRVGSRIFNPVPLLVLAFLFSVSLLFGKGIQNYFENEYLVQSEASLPPTSLSVGILVRSVSAHPFVGFGPGTYENVKNGFGTVIGNLSTDTGGSSSEVSRLLSETSSVGVIAGSMWLLFLLSVFFVSLKILIRNPEKHSVKRKVTAFGAGFLVICFITFPIGVLPLSLLFIFSGLLYAIREREGKLRSICLGGGLSSYTYIKTIVFFSLVILVSMYVFGSALLGSVIGQKIEKGEYVNAEALLSKTKRFSLDKNIYMLSAQNSLGRLFQKIQNSSGEESGEDLLFVLKNILADVDVLDVLAPNNYGVKIFESELYGEIARLGLTDFYLKSLQKTKDAEMLSPSAPLSALLQAKIYTNLGEEEKAKEALARAISLKPNYTEGYIFLAKISAEGTDGETQKQLVGQAEKINPLDVDLTFQKAILSIQVGNYSVALANLSAVIKVHPGLVAPRYYEAVALYMLGQKEEGIKKMKRLRGLSADGGSVNQALSLMLENRLEEKFPVVK